MWRQLLVKHFEDQGCQWKDDTVACAWKASIAESAQTSIARQRLATKLTHISTARNRCKIAHC
jgi:hypothetical protein